MIPMIAPMGRTVRVSSESAWPLRNAAGLTFAQAKVLREAKALADAAAALEASGG